jgi:hypothetical protein
MLIVLALACAPVALPAQEQAPRLSTEELAAREQKAGKDPVQLLLLSALAEDDAARRIRKHVHDLLASNKTNATPAELEALAVRLAAVFPRAVRTPAEVRQVLGAPRGVARQILYRRYLEQWAYDAPLPLYVVFDCHKGEEPRLQSVHLHRPEKM